MIGIEILIGQLVEDLVDIYPIYGINPKRKPKYPYLTYNVLTLQQDERYTGHYDFVKKDGDVYERLKTEPKVILSINSYSNNIYEAQRVISEAYNYFKYLGYERFYENNLTVVDLTDIQDRTIHIVDNYEFRYGFDATVRKVDIIEKKINNINKYNLDLEVEE